MMISIGRTQFLLPEKRLRITANLDRGRYEPPTNSIR